MRNEKLWGQRETAVNVKSLGESVSAALTYSAEVMVGKVVLMQPRLNSMHGAEGNTLSLFALRLHMPNMSLHLQYR